MMVQSSRSAGWKPAPEGHPKEKPLSPGARGRCQRSDWTWDSGRSSATGRLARGGGLLAGGTDERTGAVAVQDERRLAASGAGGRLDAFDQGVPHQFQGDRDAACELDRRPEQELGLVDLQQVVEAQVDLQRALLAQFADAQLLLAIEGLAPGGELREVLAALAGPIGLLLHLHAEVAVIALHPLDLPAEPFAMLAGA